MSIIPNYRKLAIQAGEYLYLGSKPCKRNSSHSGWRYVRGSACVECAKESNRARLPKRRVDRGLPLPSRPARELCEGCGKVPSNGKSLCLDHDHESGIFRGWLCDKCNGGIGLLGDDERGVKKALDYLVFARRQSATGNSP